MADPAKMTRFEVKPSGTDFTIHVANDRNETFDMVCSREQLDVLADALDDLLLVDDSADEVDAKD